jgi:hypothetical protein
MNAPYLQDTRNGFIRVYDDVLAKRPDQRLVYDLNGSTTPPDAPAPKAKRAKAPEPTPEPVSVLDTPPPAHTTAPDPLADVLNDPTWG